MFIDCFKKVDCYEDTKILVLVKFDAYYRNTKKFL